MTPRRTATLARRAGPRDPGDRPAARDVVATGIPEAPYYGLGVEMPSLDVGAVAGHGGLFPGYTSAMGLRIDSDDVVVAISNTFGYFYQWDAVHNVLLALDDARSG